MTSSWKKVVNEVVNKKIQKLLKEAADNDAFQAKVQELNEIPDGNFYAPAGRALRFKKTGDEWQIVTGLSDKDFQSLLSADKFKTFTSKIQAAAKGKKIDIKIKPDDFLMQSMRPATFTRTTEGLFVDDGLVSSEMVAAYELGQPDLIRQDAVSGTTNPLVYDENDLRYFLLPESRTFNVTVVNHADIMNDIKQLFAGVSVTLDDATLASIIDSQKTVEIPMVTLIRGQVQQKMSQTRSLGEIIKNLFTGVRTVAKFAVQPYGVSLTLSLNPQQYEGFVRTAFFKEQALPEIDFSASYQHGKDEIIIDSKGKDASNPASTLGNDYIKWKQGSWTLSNSSKKGAAQQADKNVAANTKAGNAESKQAAQTNDTGAQYLINWSTDPAKMSKNAVYLFEKTGNQIQMLAGPKGLGQSTYRKPAVKLTGNALSTVQNAFDAAAKTPGEPVSIGTGLVQLIPDDSVGRLQSYLQSNYNENNAFIYLSDLHDFVANPAPPALQESTLRRIVRQKLLRRAL